MVSIILPVYRGEKYIERSLGSIRNQMYDDFEVLVVDEFGKDGTKYKITSFNDERVKYFIKTDEGPGAAVAFGIKNASNELIAILEQDDYWFEDKLQKQVEYLESDRSVALVATDWCDGETIPEIKFSALERYRHSDNDDPFESLLSENFIATSSVMFRKQAVSSVEYPCASLNKGPWDRQLWLRIAHRYPVKMIREVLVWKYSSPVTLFNRQNYAALQYLGWLEAYKYFSDVSPSCRKKIRYNISRAAYTSARYHLSACEPCMFRKYLREAVRFDLNYMARQPYCCLYILPDIVINLLRKIKGKYFSPR